MRNKNKEAAAKPVADSVTFKNFELQTIITWLDTPLHSKQAVARNRICEIIGEKHNAFEKDRMALIDKYGKRDPKTNEYVVIPDGLGGRKYDLADQKKFDEEYKVIKDMDIVFDILPSNRDYWRMARQILLDIKVPMDIELTNFWERIIKALEDV